jgi:IclR family acetate operon transcriptional repressor
MPWPERGTQSLKLPHPTVYRLLNTLESKGYAVQDSATGLYFLSAKILRLQSTIATRRSLVVPAVAALNALVTQLGYYAAHLAVLGEDCVIYIESRRNNPYSIDYLPTGRTNPIHCTALGKVLAAYLPAEEMKALAARLSFTARTPHTITEPQAFLRALAETCHQGYAVDNEELHPGVRCLAAPVRAHTGQVVAAISVTSSVTQFPLERVPEVAQLVVGAANDVSRTLGWVPAAS